MSKKKTKKQLAEDKAWEELKGIKCISKDILDIIPICSDDSSHPIFSGVYITNDKYLATNAYIALEIKRDKKKELEVNEFPTVNKLPLKVEPMVLQLKSMRKIQKFFSKTTLPILRLGCLFHGNSEHSVKLVTTNLENTTEISYRKIEGKYPFESIDDIPKSKLNNKIEIKLNKDLLIKLLKGFGKENEIKLFINKTKGLAPLIIESENRKGLIMPFK